MVTPDGAVIVHSSAAQRRRARREVDQLVAEAAADLNYCKATGDLRPLHDAFLAVAKATRLTLGYALDLEGVA